MRNTMVVAYGSTRGHEINVCPRCEEEMMATKYWPRDPHGEEYCHVSRGLHRDVCDFCGYDYFPWRRRCS